MVSSISELIDTFVEYFAEIFYIIIQLAFFISVVYILVMGASGTMVTTSLLNSISNEVIHVKNGNYISSTIEFNSDSAYLIKFGSITNVTNTVEVPIPFSPKLVYENNTFKLKWSNWKINLWSYPVKMKELPDCILVGVSKEKFMEMVDKYKNLTQSSANKTSEGDLTDITQSSAKLEAFLLNCTDTIELKQGTYEFDVISVDGRVFLICREGPHAP
ncbi:MAG: hypothetical protein QXR62_04430 [Candidatus Bathyarchaeia archaeon]